MVVILLCISAIAAGVVNAIAGGGTLLTFPTLLAVPLSARAANVTSTTALMPGSFASAWGYRKELAACRRWAILLSPPSLLGGAIGAALLIGMDEMVFRVIVPWLVLLAAVLFLVQPRVVAWVHHHRAEGPPSNRSVAIVLFAQFLIGIYGGYFGAGIGILMLSSLGFIGLESIHEMNALKSFLAFQMNGVSVIFFLFGGEIHWQYALVMAASAIAGGYLGALLALRLKPLAVRWIVITTGFGLAAYFFWQQTHAV